MSKIKIVFIILIGLSLPVYVLWNIISVNFNYSSIGEPQSGVKVNFGKIAEKNLIIFPEEENYFFNKINLKVDFKDNQNLNQKIKITAYKNFLATFYPLNDKVLSRDELEDLLYSKEGDLPIGSLFYNGDSVSILLPDNRYQSFFSAELFEKMGYDWNDIIKKEVGFASELEEELVFNYGKPHPSGTVFETETGYYLVWEKELFPLSPEIEINKLLKTKPIKIGKLKPKSFGSCSGSLKDKSFRCDFEKDFSTDKSDYIFEINGFEKEDLREVKLSLSATPSKWSLRNNFLVSIDNAKLKLIKKYRGYIPFI
jgi:hypothetical protein